MLQVEQRCVVSLLKVPVNTSINKLRELTELSLIKPLLDQPVAQVLRRRLLDLAPVPVVLY